MRIARLTHHLISYLILLVLLNSAPHAFAQLGEYRSEVSEENIVRTYRRYFRLSIAGAKIKDDAQNQTYQPHPQSPNGNSAPYYYRACLAWQRMPSDVQERYQANIDNWLNCDLKDLPEKEVAAFLKEVEPVFVQLDAGCRQGECEWGHNFSDMDFSLFVGHDLSELGILRAIERINCVRGRLAITRGDHESATKSIQRGLRLGLDVGKMRIVIAGYIGEAICEFNLRTLLETASHVDSPNYMHLLQSLPNPLVDFLPKIRTEQQMIEREFTILRKQPNDSNPETRDSKDYWNRVVLDAMESFDQVSQWMEQGQVAYTKERTAILMARLYPLAKQELIRAGWKPELVEKMPVAKVVAIQTRRVWSELDASLSGIENLAPIDAIERRRRRVQELESQGYDQPGARGDFPVSDFSFPLVDESIVPSYGKILNRQIAMMQVVEQIRDHLARHGELPDASAYAAMDRISDPMTGNRFQYNRTSDTTAILKTPWKKNAKQPSFRFVDLYMDIELSSKSATPTEKQ